MKLDFKRFGRRFSLKTQFSILVLALVTPSLVLMTFWLRIALHDRNEIKQAREGLVLILSLEELLRNYAGDRPPDPAVLRDVTERFAASLSEEQREKFDKPSGQLRAAETYRDVVVQVQSLTFDIAADIDLEAVTPASGVALPALIKTQLLETIAQTHLTTQVLRRMAVKDEFNPWDRMAVPVQAGQFKMMADSVGRVTREHFAPNTAAASPEILEDAQNYQQANLAVQNAFGAQVRLMPTAQSGSELSMSDVNARHDQMITAAVDFWTAAVRELDGKLARAYSSQTVRVVETVALGSAIVLTSLVAMIFVGRAFRNQTLEEIAFAYRYDPLTGLPNRRSLLSDLKKMASHRGVDTAHETHLTLYQIDLAKFALINDYHGEEFGDTSLRLVADALTDLREKDGALYRLAGNTYALLSWEKPDAWRFDAYAERIEATVAQSCKSLKSDLTLSVNIGVATAPLDNLSASDLLNDASFALAAAKEENAACYKLFSPEVRHGFLRRQHFESELARALEGDFIDAYLQPQFSAIEGQIIGAEALVRWIDPESGIKKPDQFVPLAEETGLIEAIDQAVREKALATIKEATENFEISLRLGMNITTQFIENPRCIDMLQDQVLSHGLEPSMIDLEVLETVALDTEKSFYMLSQIRALSKKGFGIELDDFGTDRASLASLRDLNVDRIKIDRSFVSFIDQKNDLQIFTNALIKLGHSLNIEVLAEGVEREEEAEWLRQHGCQFFQGYHYAQPLDRHLFLEFIERHVAVCIPRSNSKRA